MAEGGIPRPPRPPSSGWFWMERGIFALGLTGNAFMLYSYLCDVADSEAICFPSIAQMMEVLGLSRKHTYRTLDELIDYGLVERKGRVPSKQRGGQGVSAYLVKSVVGLEGQRRHTKDPECHPRHIDVSPATLTEGSMKSVAKPCFPSKTKGGSIPNEQDPNSSGRLPKAHGKPSIAAIVDFWLSNAGQMLSPIAVEQVGKYLDEGAASDFILAVMRDCLKANHLQFSYVLGALNRLSTLGIRTLEAYEMERTRHEQAKQARATRQRQLEPDSLDERRRQMTALLAARGGAK